VFRDLVIGYCEVWFAEIGVARGSDRHWIVREALLYTCLLGFKIDGSSYIQIGSIYLTEL